MSSRKTKIAIIGGGISGLSAGWLLAREKQYDVTLFEAMAANGLDGYAYDVPTGHPVFKNSYPLHIDVPFRYHVPNIYANLTQMCRVLGVKTQQYEQDIVIYDSEGSFLFGYATQHLGKYSFPLPYFRNFVTTKFWKLMWEFYWFRKTSWKHWQEKKLGGKTFEDYLKEMNCSKQFTEDFLYNYLSLVHTCTYDTLKQYPAELLVKFLYEMTSGYGLWRFTNGTKDVAERLMKPFTVRTNCLIKTITIEPDEIQLHLPDGTLESFDHVVIATQPTVAVRILNNVPQMVSAKKVLCNFPVVQSSMTIHTDSTLLPSQGTSKTTKNYLQSWNNSSVAHKILNKNYIELGYLDNPIVVQTWSMDKSSAKPETIISEARMSRQVHNLDSLKAADDINELQGRHNVWFCGGYTLHSVPLLESGVISACEVAKAFGCKIPWQFKPLRKPGPEPTSYYSTLFKFFLVLLLVLWFVY